MNDKLINIKDLEQIIEENLVEKSEEFRRLFHGRGNYYGSYNYLTVDSIDDILFVCFFEEVSKEIEEELLGLFKQIFSKNEYKSLVLQRRYLPKSPNEVLEGELNEDINVIENSLKYKISFTNKNIGLFPDMKAGRKFIQDISKDKNVLNLFSYTCAFSVCAIKGGAKQVVNIDMAKGALSIGRENHRINNLDTKKVKFLPHNILKSWNCIKKDGPYDIIIIDPPSFQKGSFTATNDYLKIIKRLDSLASKDCIVLSCLNAPELDTKFIKDIFEENASEFVFEQRLDNLSTFPTNNEEKTLKNLIFKRII
jgi:23S rRNA (cytosine1962-C5)-methyltransferase